MSLLRAKLNDSRAPVVSGLGNIIAQNEPPTPAQAPMGTNGYTKLWDYAGTGVSFHVDYDPVSDQVLTIDSRWNTTPDRAVTLAAADGAATLVGPTLGPSFRDLSHLWYSPALSPSWAIAHTVSGAAALGELSPGGTLTDRGNFWLTWDYVAQISPNGKYVCTAHQAFENKVWRTDVTNGAFAEYASFSEKPPPQFLAPMDDGSVFCVLNTAKTVAMIAPGFSSLSWTADFRSGGGAITYDPGSNTNAALKKYVIRDGRIYLLCTRAGFTNRFAIISIALDGTESEFTEEFWSEGGTATYGVTSKFYDDRSGGWWVVSGSFQTGGSFWDVTRLDANFVQIHHFTVDFPGAQFFTDHVDDKKVCDLLVINSAVGGDILVLASCGDATPNTPGSNANLISAYSID